MSVLFVVVPLAVLASAAAVFAFIWSVRQGQLDDLSTPALRILESDQAGCVASSPPLSQAAPTEAHISPGEFVP